VDNHDQEEHVRVCPHCERPMDRRCVSCGHLFAMAFNEFQFFVRKGLKLPLRCPACREKRRLVGVQL
jgi:putative zinc ribbon protein